VKLVKKDQKTTKLFIQNFILHLIAPMAPISYSHPILTKFLQNVKMGKKYTICEVG